MIDVNGDGATNLSDALLILQCDVGITNDFCPGTVVVVNSVLPTADESAMTADDDQTVSHQLFLPLVTR